MPVRLSEHVAIVGIGQTEFGVGLPDSPLKLGARALKDALDDAGLTRADVDGVALHSGWPLGNDYDRIAEAYGLNLRWVQQAWLHGRFSASVLQAAAMAVASGVANVVACINAISYGRVRTMLAGAGDLEGTREDGGTHGEYPAYGLTSPASGAAMAMQRYMALYGATSEQLATIPVTFRRHAMLSPYAVMKKPLSVAQHQASRMIVDPLRLYDCCPVTDGAVVVLVTSRERAKDLKKSPVFLAGVQGIRAGRDEFVFGPRCLGINQQDTSRRRQCVPESEVYAGAGMSRDSMDGFYTYDAFSPLVLFALERFGFCGEGEAAGWIQAGRIGLGGELPVNTSGGLLAEAHMAGWNSFAEIVRQLRAEAGARQIPGARRLQWGTSWGDSIIFTNES
jgi:acetyl-CoA acetyltransferase